MLFPTVNEVTRYREMTTAFGGYNHQLSCQEGQFYDMRNMTSQYYPILSPRKNRGIVKKLSNPQGILDKEELMWIDDGVLYVNGEAVVLEGVSISKDTNKTMAKMGAYIVIMPDKIWYNSDSGECGYMEVSFKADSSVSFALCEADGSAITWHDAAYYEENEPADGNYMMSTVNGKTSLKVYSATTGIWGAVATTYIQISSTGIGRGFEKGDGVKISLDNIGTDWAYAANIFVNEEDDGRISTNTVIYDRTDDCITIAALLDENKTFESMSLMESDRYRTWHL